MRFRRFGLLAVLIWLAVSPTLAVARGYRRSGGTVSTPFGTMNMNSPEYKMAGGNPLIYQQIMEEKMMMQQQMLWMKSQQRAQQQMQKLAKSKKGAAELPPAGSVSNVTSLSARKTKKKHPVTTSRSVTDGDSTTKSKAKP